MDYIEFLKTKIELAPESGFEVDRSKINKALKPHQADAVAWALRGGSKDAPERLWLRTEPGLLPGRRGISAGSRE